ncbi:MAG TPA: 3'(2'),5'-bisphosphate nucleotidase CysQ [Polyangiaceae bacterium]|nr:3'(2'),5'-bisphosphate nucleotidase CysQ [Polyangiaceae bacterium]
MSDLGRLAEVATAAAREASGLIMSVYGTAFEVQYKAKDDPVTRADREANDLLCRRLAQALPGVPIVAEESDPSSYAGFAQAGSAWFVDPLDGTREFVERNGEFAVMIGLAVGGSARIGVIAAPAWGRTFVGVVGEGAWEVAPHGDRTPIRVSERATLAGASVVVSRSRRPARLASILEKMRASAAFPHGSSGLKGALVAIGAHDVYLQPGNAGMRWDACATDALVRAAGGLLTQADGTDIDYAANELTNARGMVATNGRLHTAVLDALRED